jgi:hypothetical protein
MVAFNPTLNLPGQSRKTLIIAYMGVEKISYTDKMTPDRSAGNRNITSVLPLHKLPLLPP